METTTQACRRQEAGGNYYRPMHDNRPNAHKGGRRLVSRYT